MATVENGILRFPASSDKFGARPLNDEQVLAETPVHDAGHVALVSVYGSDDLIVDAAQVSYGKTIAALSESKRPYRSPGETRRLIRYLMRHRHTSPFEQAEVTFYLRVPIFVMRQLIRHRTANVNEYSARYSELSDDYYIPSAEYIQRQSTTNKQGRGGEPFTGPELAEITNIMVETQENAVRGYKRLIELGLARELARVPMPVGGYTECYWKCDLHNFMHLLQLRVDPHAQQEIRDFADPMYEMVKPFFPFSIEAWEDYRRYAYTMSALELKKLGEILRKAKVSKWGDKPMEMSEREWSDFKFLLDTLLIREW